MLETQPDKKALLDFIDPRLRILVAGGMSVVIALISDFRVLAVAVVAVIVGLAISGLAIGVVCRRLLPLNLVMLVMVAVLPLTTEGTTAFTLGSLEFSREGLEMAGLIALKGNAIVLALMVLLGRLDAVALGHALSHLHVPRKLSHLLLFTVRYLDVLHQEYLRLRAAMKIRGFRAGANGHTYRSLGYLAGMLLVRSFDRSERIVAAMKCRGFRGHFYIFEHFHYHWCDVPFAIVSIAILAGMAAMQWCIAFPI